MNVKVYVDLSSVRDGPGRCYAGSDARTIEHETFGRRYSGGIRVTC